MDSRAQGHRRGEPAFRRASLATFFAGVAAFVLLYAPQPLLPLLTEDLRVSPTGATLSMAVCTTALALALLPASWLSDAWGRVRVITLALIAGSLLGVAAAAVPGFGALLLLRALQGVALAGVPAVAMTYLAEEIAPSSLGSSIGLYIGGNALGGMAGRLLAGALAQHGDWRMALAGVGAVSLVCAVAFWRLAPPSRALTRSRFTPAGALTSLSVHLRDPGQRLLCAMAALLMGTFMAVYNALAFRLADAPFGLSATAIAAIFLVYPIGSLSSAVAGRLAEAVGRRRVLPIGVVITLAGVAVTAAESLPLIVLGVALVTIGFFAAHSVASSWIGRRAYAAPAQASALYLLAYYAGSSLLGPLGGLAWSTGRWPDVIALATLLLAIALRVSLRLRSTRPPRPVRPAW